MNLGQAEANALTRAGAWSDDCVAAPVLLDTQYDPVGPSRVRVEITRTYERNDVVRAARPRQAKRHRGGPATKPAGGTGRVAYLDGKPVALEDALKIIG